MMISLVIAGDNTKGGADSLAVSPHGDCGQVYFKLKISFEIQNERCLSHLAFQTSLSQQIISASAYNTTLLLCFTG